MYREIKRICFIKLGSKSDNLEIDCLNNGKMVLGYEQINHFIKYNSLNIDDLQREISEKYKSDKGATTRHAKQIISFYDKNDTTLWITFSQRKVWWGFVDNSKEPYQNEKGFTYRTMIDGWKCTDINNRLLTFENVSGALLKTQGFQGTICDISQKDSFPIEEYTIRLIYGEKLEEVKQAEKNKKNIENSMADLLKMLHPKDFEYIIELIFQYSGWKKLTPGAGVEKDLDLDLLMPLTNERAFVQIKSQTTNTQYNEYKEIFKKHEVDYDRFYYVYHTWENKNIDDKIEDKKINFLNIDKISELIVELGLITILMKKVS